MQCVFGPGAVMPLNKIINVTFEEQMESSVSDAPSCNRGKGMRGDSAHCQQ